MRSIQLCFPTQGNVSSVDSVTYLYYMEIKNHYSLPSQGKWVSYDGDAERILLEDYRRLWGTNFLNDLTIEVLDEPWSNGVVGKRAIFIMEERERVKIVDFVGSKELDREKIDEKLQEQGIVIRLDTFIDLALVRRVKGVLKQMFAEKGYHFAEITHTIEPMAGGPKLVHLTFNMDEGPKVRIADIDFIGNTAMSDRALKRKMKNTKERWFLSWITGRGTYKEEMFEDDAEKIIEHYRNEGYITARVGQPDVNYLPESKDGDTRGVRLRVPVTEGERYRVGELKFDGHTVVKPEALQKIFEKIRPGRYYSEADVRKGFEKARELYGSIGYYEFTGFPDLSPRTGTPADQNGGGGSSDIVVEDRPTRIQGDPVVDVTIRLQEGKQYFVNRITFVGNKSTHDEVIRREMQLVEGGVFDTEALKYSVRRLNQLGYFEALEDKGIGIAKTQAAENEVDVTLTLKESNLNQLTFGAGVSQFDGFFGQLSFQTTNFLGRGESLTLSLQDGSRAENYQLAFTEPFMFGRPITGGVDLFKRNIEFIGQFTEKSLGGGLTFGYPLARFTRMFLNYSYEQTKTTLDTRYFGPEYFTELLRFSPYLQDAVGRCNNRPCTISKITPTVRLNTVDHPIFPTTGRMYSAAFELAGMGGNTRFYRPRLEGVWYLRHTGRTTVGLRGQVEYIAPYGRTTKDLLPIFERTVLGGEYSVRGFDIRSIGPRHKITDPETGEEIDSGLVIGGNKSVLFNAEYQITIAGPVRLVLFYDAGQVRDFGESYAFNQFKTSTGWEVRFFMPILNVPFRLIWAYNPQREGILNDRFRPQEPTVFRFAVGTTF